MNVQLQVFDPDGRTRIFADGKLAIVHSDQISKDLMLHNLEDLQLPKTNVKCSRSEDRMRVVYMTFYIRGNAAEMSEKAKKITCMSPQKTFFFEPADIENMEQGIEVSLHNYTLKMWRAELKNVEFKKCEEYPKCITECSKILQSDQMTRALLMTISLQTIAKNGGVCTEIMAANMRLPVLLTPFNVDVYQLRDVCAANSTINVHHNFNRLVAAVVQAFIQHCTEIGLFYEKCGATCAKDIMNADDETKEQLYLYMSQYMNNLLEMKRKTRDVEIAADYSDATNDEKTKVVMQSVDQEWVHLKDKIFEAFEYFCNHINSEYAYDSGLGFQKTEDDCWNCVRTKGGETQNLSGIPLKATVQVRRDEFASKLKSGDKSLEFVSELIDIDDCEGLAAKNTVLLDMLHELSIDEVYTMVDQTLEMPEHVHHFLFRPLIMKCLEQLKMDPKNVVLGLVFAGSAHAGNADKERHCNTALSASSSHFDTDQYARVMDMIKHGAIGGHAVPVYYEIDREKSFQHESFSLNLVRDFKFYEATGMVVECNDNFSNAEKMQMLEIYKFLSASKSHVKVCIPKKSLDMKSWYCYSIAMGSLSVETENIIKTDGSEKARIEPFSLLKNQYKTSHYLIDMPISTEASLAIQQILKTMRHSYVTDDSDWRQFQTRTKFVWSPWYERVPPTRVLKHNEVEIIPFRMVISGDKNNTTMRQACTKYKSLSYQIINSHCSIVYFDNT
jgi:hypothetical protein